MKKKVLGLAIAAMSFVAFSGMAQTPTTAESNCASAADCPQKECVKKECSKKECCKLDKKGRRGAIANPFEGINLSADQQAKIKQLDERRREARKQKAADRKAAKHQADSAHIAAFKAERKAYLGEVKEILGPENYMIYLENIVINGQANGPKMHKSDKFLGKHKKADGRRGDRKHGKADKRQARADIRSNANAATR